MKAPAGINLETRRDACSIQNASRQPRSPLAAQHIEGGALAEVGRSAKNPSVGHTRGSGVAARAPFCRFSSLLFLFWVVQERVEYHGKGLLSSAAHTTFQATKL